MDAPPAGAAAPATGWRVGALEVASPADLIEGGLALLDSLAGDPVPTLRWYRSTSTAVVLGRGQRLPSGATGAEVVQRYSGGGAVLLTPDMLLLDVALPAGHRLLHGDVSSVFLAVGRAWAVGLAALGLDGLAVHEGPAQARRRGNARERLLAAVCFATLGRGEVTIAGRKVVGLSQRRRRHGALVQCGLLRRWNPGPLLEALGAAEADAGIAAAAVGLDEAWRRAGRDADPPSDGAVMRHVDAALIEEYAGNG